MKRVPLCEPYLWENSKVLLNTGFFVKQHGDSYCVSEIVNHILFIFIVAFVTAGILTIWLGNPYILLAGFLAATAWITPNAFKLIAIQKEVEGFQSEEVEIKRRPTQEEIETVQTPSVSWKGDKATAVYDVIGKGAAPAYLTLPTVVNPFMNILVDEIKYHPTRPMAVNVTDPSVKIGLDEFFRTNFYADPTDVFGRSQGQREFYTMPSTSIPNDVDSYQKWLYRIPGKTCKEGGREACLPGTDTGHIPWLNSD